MEDKNIQLIRDLVIENIDFDEVDKMFQDHRDDKGFYVFSGFPYTTIIEKIKIEDEDDCEKYKLHLGSIKRDDCPELNSLRHQSFYSDSMKKAFLLDDEEIKSYGKNYLTTLTILLLKFQKSNMRFIVN